MRANTFRERRRLYLLARILVVRHYQRQLTIARAARALSTSTRQLQRAYAQFGKRSFHEDLVAQRMVVAARLLAEQTIPVREVAHRVGYCHGPHFSAAFRRHYGVAPSCFRERARDAAAGRAAVRL
jgi:AraC-like DNA-binding protein